MNGFPTISVVIPTYNRAELVADCVRSVISQTAEPLEIIVVDDGSTDDTAEVLCKFQDRITYVSQDNAGPGAARNNGIRRATGDYIAFIDSDDLWTPWTIEVIQQILGRESAPTIVLLRRMEFETSVDLESLNREDLVVRDYQDFFDYGDGGALFGSGVLVVRRNTVMEVGGFTTHLMCAEDLDLGMKLGVASGLASIESPIMVCIRRTPSSLTRSASAAFKGMQFLYEQEAKKAYPGGEQRKWQRRSFLTFMARGKSIQMLLAKRRGAAWKLYFDSLWWHIRLGKFSYLLVFPFINLFGLVRLVSRRDDVVE